MSTVLRENRIRQIAYELSEKAGFPPDSDERFWLQAEQQHDTNLNQWAGTPADIYSSHMQRFYGRWEVEKLKIEPEFTEYLGGKTIGNFYLQDMRDEKELSEAILNLRRNETWGLYDVSLLNAFEDLDEMTKRSLLMTDSSLLASDSEARHTYMRFDAGAKAWADDEEAWRRQMQNLPASRRYPFTSLAPDAHQLEYFSNFAADHIDEWLTQLRPMLEQGKIFLLPRTRHTKVFSANVGGNSYDIHDNVMFDAIVRNGRVKTFFSDSPEKQSFIKFLAEVPLPVIGDVSLEVFAKVYSHEIEATNMLKSVLRENFLALDLAKGAQMPDTALMKVEEQSCNERRSWLSEIFKELAKRTSSRPRGCYLVRVLLFSWL